MSGFGNVFSLVRQSDGKIYAGGISLIRYHPDGAVDTAFSGGTGSYSIRAIEVQPNGKIIIGGNIPLYNGIAVNNLARLNLDGSLDSTFNVGSSASGTILALALQPDGKVIAGGQFSKFNSTEKFSLVRLQSSLQTRPALFDFDGDGKADISVFRPSNGIWYLNGSTTGFTALQFGVSTDKITPTDYDGDGKADLAVFRPSSGVWYVLGSSRGYFAVQFGQSGDVPQMRLL